jgi:hypothetical protein
MPPPRVERVKTQFICKCDCNDHPPNAFAVLTAPVGRSGLSGRASIKPTHHLSAPQQRQLESPR